MKKRLSVFTVMCLLAAVLAGCSANDMTFPLSMESEKGALYYGMPADEVQEEYGECEDTGLYEQYE